eukprot:TRINITY_DN3788_c0_g1_i3.p1 TRINITY_DN3788_c0_g1~~TRINITY_DN3788_c0_g1_i3.p1  ORF type:complete len:292 (-),score=42.96 TRINITY_DN3788_c0_g1_i3:95-970(-)
MCRFFGAYAIMDVFQDDIYYNLPIPPNIPDQLWKNLTFAYQMDMYIELYGSPKQKQLVSTPFYQELIAIFKQNIEGTSTTKWHMYSAHDTTIGQFLTALNLTTYNCIYEIFTTGTFTSNACVYQYPNFATSLIVELYQDNIGRYVKVLYNGEYQPLCNSKNTECDYNEFVMRISNAMLSEPDFQSLCSTGKLLSERFYESEDIISKKEVKKEEIQEEKKQVIINDQLGEQGQYYAKMKEEGIESDWIAGKISIIIIQFLLIGYLIVKSKQLFSGKARQEDAMQSILIANSQ